MHRFSPTLQFNLAFPTWTISNYHSSTLRTPTLSWTCQLWVCSPTTRQIRLEDGTAAHSGYLWCCRRSLMSDKNCNVFVFFVASKLCRTGSRGRKPQTSNSLGVSIMSGQAIQTSRYSHVASKSPLHIGCSLTLQTLRDLCSSQEQKQNPSNRHFGRPTPILYHLLCIHS